MLTGVTGILDSAGDDWVRLQVSGFVIHIAVPASVVYQVGSVGDTVSLHTYLRIREEQLSLYGFISSDDLEILFCCREYQVSGREVPWAYCRHWARVASRLPWKQRM